MRAVTMPLLGLLSCCSIALLSCSERASTDPIFSRSPSSVSEYLTSDVSSALDSNGRFSRLAYAGEYQPLLDTTVARRLADSYVQHHGPFFRAYIERVHGTSVDFNTLQADEVYLAGTPYEELPLEIPEAIRRAYGPYFVIPYFTGDRQVLAVSVSARATHLRLEDGKIVWPAETGNEFRLSAVPADGSVLLPPSPEGVVEWVFRQTGSRIGAVPKLVQPNKTISPELSFWEVKLDVATPVRGSESSATRETAVLYVDYNGGLHIPVPPQPSVIAVPYLSGSPDSRELRQTTTGLRKGHYLKFERITRLDSQ